MNFCSKKSFVKIDEQAWYCHFKTEPPHPIFSWLYWKYGCVLLKCLRKLACVNVINTFDLDGGEKVTSINKI